MNYSLSLKNQYGQLPIALVIATKSVTNVVSLKFVGPNDHDMDNIRCDLWSKKRVILSSNSIKLHLKNAPLQKLAAFGHFLTQKKRCILWIDKKHDATIQLLYQIAKDKFENECQVEEEKLMVIQDLYYKGNKQFRKIADCAKMVIQWTNFFDSQERKFSSQCRETTPIEDTPDVSDLSAPSYQSNVVCMGDETYVENFMSKLTGRMNWDNCYKQGRENGSFMNYNNWKSIKAAYNGRKGRIQRREL